MADKRVPTKFIDLTTQDFGPEQEDLGSRVKRVGKPPPTEFIQIPQRVREETDVLLELHSKQGTLAERGRRLARTAVSVWEATWDSARRAAINAGRAVRDATHRNGNSVGRVIVLQHETPLRLRADEKAPFTIKMAAGSSVVIYPEIDGPAGWLAARAPGGELGWVSAERVL